MNASGDGNSKFGENFINFAQILGKFKILPTVWENFTRFIKKFIIF
jgi:hypothetical protein